MTASLTLKPEGLEIGWPDGITGRFPFIWLRDTDPAGFHPQTGERAFDLTSIPIDITAQQADLQGDALIVHWPDRTEPSAYDLDWLKENRPGRARPDPANVNRIAWRGDLGPGRVPRRDATAIRDSDAALADWLEVTKRYGLSIVDGIPDDADAGIALARRVGHLRETNFGLTFEVVSKPDPNNLAYTSDALPLHTDLTNQELPPGFQFLHCIANAARGGGSTFCDGLAVARDLAQTDPDAFELLCAIPVPFRFHDPCTDIRSRKTVLRRDTEGEIVEVCFNAHIADILDIAPDKMPGFYRAYRQFMEMTRDPAYSIALRLAPGEMVVFDNRRVLHGREAFDPSTGKRHLRGTYVDRGEWDSRLRVLSRTTD